MGRKCSVGGCRSNYDDHGEKVSVYGFPMKDKQELERWLAVLPNVIDAEKVTRNMGVCAVHWPDGTEMISVNGKQRPRVPPSIFSVPKSFVRQTVPTKPRNTHERLSAASRSAIPDELDEFNKRDKIADFASCVSVVYDFIKTLSVEFHILKANDDFIHMVSFKDEMYLQPEISIRIQSNMAISAFYFHTPVSVRHLLGFQAKLGRWSQLQNIVNELKNSNVSLSYEVKNLVQQLESHDVDDLKKLSFLLEQLSLQITPCNGRRYSASTMNIAMNIYLNSNSCYRAMRANEILALPAPKTLRANIGHFNTVGTEAEAQEISSLVFSSLSENGRRCLIVFDEIYVKPSLRFRGGHVMGYAADKPDELARTILAFMVRLIFSPKKSMSSFLIKFVPVHSLTADFLRLQLDNVIRLVERAGGRCEGLMGDNHAANRKAYKQLAKGVGGLFRIEHPVDDSRFLYLLHDPVHLMKCLRNNWLSEQNQQIRLQVPGKESYVTGSFSDVAELYEKEKLNMLKRTTLTSCAVDPTNIEKTKVAPVLQVFHDKTVAALAEDGSTETAGFIFHLLRMWKILNNKSTTSHITLNDVDRSPITSETHQSLTYLSQVAESVRRMPRGKGRNRIQSFTPETSDALCQTLGGLVELSKTLLEDQAIKFILLGVFQSDCIEGEFGVYRQAFGGLYYITYEQVLIAAKTRRLKLLESFGISLDDLSELPACNFCVNMELSSNDEDLIDSLHEHAIEISPEERSTVFYVAGFICKAENITVDATSLQEEYNHGIDSDCEFTRLVSRGKLVYPPSELFEYCLLCYTFSTKSPKTCRRQLVFMFEKIHEAYSNFHVTNRVNLRLANTIISGHVRTVTDSGDKSGDARKVQKLSSA